MKRVSALISALIILLVSGALADEGYRDAWVLCNPKPGNHVNVRSHPSKGGEVIATVDAGDYIPLTGKKQGRWYQCDVPCEAGMGWIRGDYLVFDKPVTFTGGRKYRTTNGKVYARYSIKGNKCATLKKGATVTVLLMASEWAVTDRGFIMTEFLEEVGPDG